MPEDKNKTHNEDFLGLDDEDEDTQANKYMTFRTGKEAYGISIRFIREIIELQKITEVPDMPVYVKGVINLRGKVIPVIDLRLRFGLEARVYDDRTCIIIIELKDMIGFIVDSVDEVLEIMEKDIEPAPKFKSVSGKERYIMGMGKVGEAVKILLDVEKILYEGEVESISKALNSNLVNQQ
jgi:purine-binding chemotaxis protein CheW